MKLINIKLNLFFLGILFLASCNGGDYLQEYEDYKEFSKIENPRLTGWFPVELIKSDASNIKNISYLSTKCVFGVFDYENDELYDNLFKTENQIEKKYKVLFQKQIGMVKNIIPEWFPKTDYWNEKLNGIILFDNCYAYRDSTIKQIYYFHPEEESTILDGEIYPGIRSTIR